MDTAEDIIDDILDKQKQSDGKKYWYEMEGKKLRVYQLSDEPVKLMYKPAINVNAIDVCQWHSDMMYSHSMSKLYDSVKVVIKSSTDGALPALEYTLTDNDHVRKYGKIQKIITLNAKEKDEVGKTAKNELNANNDLTREMGFGTFGCIDARVNVCTVVNDEYTGIDSLLRITEAVHNYEAGKYTMDLKFELIKEYAADNLTTNKVQRESLEEKVSKKAEAVIDTARQLKGKIRYVWGGNDPNSGMDCSHFVYWVFKNCGKNNILKSKGYGTAATIYSWSKHISASNRQPGDIVYFDNGKYNHIGIYTGNGKMIHCNSSTNGVAENNVASGGNLVGYGRLW